MTVINNTLACKQAAVEFLQLGTAGHIDEAYQKYVDPQGKHHNPYFAAGFAALKQGMIDNHHQFPNKQLTVQHVLGDGDLVAVHSHVVLKPGENGIATLHLFRFHDNKIVELWDFGQPVPNDSPNHDGIF
ncbi:MAG: nuclear transport factor 2 family protein [Chloroflexi bacterium]|nr:nuclear transport factor 2 family protein [Chloroflexota bacterium]